MDPDTVNLSDILELIIGEASNEFNLAVQNVQKAFHNLCPKGHIISAQTLLKFYPKLMIRNDTFRDVCANGQLETAKWVLNVNPDIDISAYNEAPFRCACLNGHLEVAKWLLFVNPNINISTNNNCVFC